jgi:hypothetical protein
MVVKAWNKVQGVFEGTLTFILSLEGRGNKNVYSLLPNIVGFFRSSISRASPSIVPMESFCIVLER